MVIRSHSRQSQIDHFGGDTRSGLFGNSLSEHSGTRPGILYSYDGKYAAFLEQKEARLALKNAAMQNLKANYNAELESMRRQPQARQSKSKLRIDAFLQIATGHDDAAIGSKFENLGELQGGKRQLGGTILKLTDVSLAFGPDKVMQDHFSYNFIEGDGIGIVGRNGGSKSSFIRILYVWCSSNGWRHC